MERWLKLMERWLKPMREETAMSRYDEEEDDAVEPTRLPVIQLPPVIQGVGPSEFQRMCVRAWAAMDIPVSVIAVKLSTTVDIVKAAFKEELKAKEEAILADTIIMTQVKAASGDMQAIRYLDTILRKRIAERRPKGELPKKLGKKDQAKENAKNAGKGTEWGDDLEPRPATRVVN